LFIYGIDRTPNNRVFAPDRQTKRKTRRDLSQAGSSRGLIAEDAWHRPGKSELISGRDADYRISLPSIGLVL
jgi:hypothetical protein